VKSSPAWGGMKRGALHSKGLPAGRLQGFEKSVTLLGEELPVPPSVPATSVLVCFATVRSILLFLERESSDLNQWDGFPHPLN
jgi:hypothetical protein